jgi:hypothetical protein
MQRQIQGFFAALRMTTFLSVWFFAALLTTTFCLFGSSPFDFAQGQNDNFFLPKQLAQNDDLFTSAAFVICKETAADFCTAFLPVFSYFRVD